MRKKSTWDTLPNEILELIVSHCGRNCNSVKWMFANKKWFNYYLSQAYHSVNIDLSKQSVKFDQITLYKLNVGRWVKKITFSGFPKVNDITQHYIPGDELSSLIERTSNVEEVCFSSNQTFDITAWTYFSVIFLKDNYCWKLRVLPTPTNGILYSSVYYVCAYHARHTLRSLYLTLGMVGFSEYKCLKEFTALETLHFGKGFVNSFDELGAVLKILTNLKEIIVDLGSNRFLMLPPKLEDKPYLYPNIKEITFNNFTPKENDELLIFAENFIGLEKLRIVCGKNTLWPAAEVDPVVTEMFFDYLGSLSEYQITVEGDVSMASLMEKWNRSVKSCPREVFLSIEYEIVTNYPNTLPHSSLTISENKSRSTKSLYYSISDQSYRLLGNENILAIISDIVSKIQLSGLNGDNQLFRYLKTIFQQTHPNLKNVTAINSKLFSYDLRFLAPEDLSLEGLEFHNCTIDLRTFEIFSSRFNSFNYVKFIDCLFTKVDHDNFQYLSMKNSAVGTIYISNYKAMNNNQYPYHTSQSNPQQSIVSITVYLADQDITKYFIFMDHHIMDVQHGTYSKFISKFSAHEMTTINIKVKSIKKLLLKPIQDGSDFIQIRI